MSGAGLVNAFGWTLLHFLWQGALVGGATAAALAALRQRPAGERYAVACAGLLLCLAWPAAELWLRLGNLDRADAALSLLGGGAGAATGEAAWLTLLRGQLAAIVVCWAVCAAALALRMGLGLLWIGRAAEREAPDPVWQAKLERLAARCGVTRSLRLRVVAGLASPVTAGWHKPLVLVPASVVSGMPAHLLEALLVHELAHIRRHDYLVNLAQNVVETLLFYHPAVWWISHRIRIEREHLADDFAAGVLGEPRRLALALSELERLQFSSPRLAQAANGGDLMARIRRLLRPDTQARNWKAALAVLGLAVTGAAAFAHAAPAALPMPDRMAVADFASCPRPAYPDEAVRLEREGTVELSFLVGSDGRVKQTRVAQSAGFDALDEAARSALAACSFRPASLGGKPVAAWAKVQYVWTLR